MANVSFEYVIDLAPNRIKSFLLLQYLFQAFAAISIREIAYISTTTKMSSSRHGDSNQRPLGEKRERCICALKRALKSSFKDELTKGFSKEDDGSEKKLKLFQVKTTSCDFLLRPRRTLSDIQIKRGRLKTLFCRERERERERERVRACMCVCVCARECVCVQDGDRE